MTDFQIALTTCANQQEAERIARHLVEGRLAACVNLLGGVRSIYRWRDAVESSDEVLLIIKTESSRAREVEAAVASLHSYETPEFLLLPIAGGSDGYLNWLRASLESAG
jgi:periplasmic divalent cation tolerance protein